MRNGEVYELARGQFYYPRLLDRVFDAPNPLYCLGKCSKEIFDNTLAVVGSRDMTIYGQWLVNSIIKEVAKHGITIVSGFMYGVDVASHKAALEVGGKTIAVMAGGVSKAYPNSQKELFQNIVEKGLVVSEYKDCDISGSWMFARRNRIIAGLSSSVFVVEAAQSSGSLITASYAKLYDRDILVAPANLTSKNSYGITYLLKNGAKLITGAEDIIKLFFGDSYASNVKSNKALRPKNFDRSAQKVLSLLDLEPLSADEISQRLKSDISTVLRILADLCVYDAVTEREGRYYVN